MRKFFKKIGSNEYSIFFLGASLLCSILIFIVANLNIHGDAKFHTLYAKESAESENIVQDQPHRIYRFDNGTRIYAPIAYPLTSTTLFTTIYLFMGETGLKLYSPFMGTLIFTFVYLCLRELGPLKAVFISFFAVLSITERLKMTPLMEPYIVVMLLGSIYLMKRYLLTDRSIYLFLSAVFLGSAAAIKQQGLLISLSLVAFLLGYLAWMVFTKHWVFKKKLLPFSIFFIIYLFIPLPALIDQQNRTGTLAFSPGKIEFSTKLPFSNLINQLLMSKFDVNPDAVKAINDTVFYRRGEITPESKLKEIFLAPFLFYRSKSTSYIDSAYDTLFKAIMLMLVFIILFTSIYKMKKNPIFYILLFVINIELFISFVLKTPITQYHSFGVLGVTMFLFYVSFSTASFSKYLSLFAFSLLTINFISGYLIYIGPTIFNSGRETDYQLNSYKKMGEFVQENTSPQDIFLAAESSFRYYSQRDVVWLNENFGDKTRLIITSSNESEIKQNLSDLYVSYVVINKEQAKRVGVGDYLPPEGLFSLVNQSKLFTPIYDPNGDQNIILYKVNYL